MKKMFIQYLKHSGMWVGFVFNPYHWEFKIIDDAPFESNVFDTCIRCGPVWIRLVIDHGYM